PQGTETCTVDYTLTQKDVDSGAVTNTATTTGTPPTGTAVTSDPSTAKVTIPATSAITLVKSADVSKNLVAGQVVHYSFLVTNTGNTTLSGISVADTTFDGS